MFDLRWFLAAAVGLFAAANGVPARAAITGGQVDDFEDVSDVNKLTAGWSNGSGNPNPATNVAGGGPAGSDDNYMRLESTGSGSGGRLVAFNTDQWGGDYLAAGVSAIRMHVNNTSTAATSPPFLTLRLILVDSLDGQSIATLAPVNVAKSSGWTTVEFSLAPGNLSGTAADYSTVMANVTELNLVHCTDVVTDRRLTPTVVAQLGVDNITAVVAVPEPAAVALASTGFVAATCRGRRRRAASYMKSKGPATRTAGRTARA